MYRNFYGLAKEPFHITPDPSFLFLSPSHKEALGSVIYGIERRKGFVAITGEVGLGKTTILRAYLEKANKEQIKIIYLFNTNISFKDLLKAIYGELGIEIEVDNVFDMVNRLHQELIDEYKKGRNVVLIIDEAQNMPVETIENLRMLSNLETSKDKLIQILLIGQPELETKINLHELRQLKQRIAIRAVISPLTQEESIAYIQHRLAKASLTKKPVFTPGAMALIAKHSRGIPRVINILSNLSLVAGLGHRRKPVDTKLVKEVIADYKGEKKSPFPMKRGIAYAALILLLLAGGIFWASPQRDPFLSKMKDLTSYQIAGLLSKGEDHRLQEENATVERDADSESAVINESGPGAKVIKKISKPPEASPPQQGQGPGAPVEPGSQSGFPASPDGQ